MQDLATGNIYISQKLVPSAEAVYDLRLKFI